MKPSSFVIRVSYGLLAATTNPARKITAVIREFSIIVLQVGSAACVNDPVIFLEKG